ncbi:MAG: hypothetical protein WA188_11555 [Terriglobales bacterium]
MSARSDFLLTILPVLSLFLSLLATSATKGSESRWYIVFTALPVLCLAILLAGAFAAKRQLRTMDGWKQGVCGTSILLGAIGCLMSLIAVVLGYFKVGGRPILGLLAAIICTLCCPTAFVMGLVVRTNVGKLVMSAEVVQGVWLLMLFSTGGVL